MSTPDITDTDHALTVTCGCTPLRPEDVRPFDVVTHVQGDSDWVFVLHLTNSEYDALVRQADADLATRYCSFCDDQATGHIGTWSHCADHRSAAYTEDRNDATYQGAFDGPTCSICDGLGHGYPGAGPCPLEVTDYSGEPWWAQ